MAAKYVNPNCPACGKVVDGDGVLIGKVKVRPPMTQEQHDRAKNRYPILPGRVGYSVFEFTATAQDYKRNVYHEGCV